MVPALGDSSSPFPRAKRSACEYDEYHRDDEVADLHDVVKCGHRRFERVDESGYDDAADERFHGRAEVAPVKELAPGLQVVGVGMRLAHSDNAASFSSASPVRRNVVQPSKGAAPMRL